MILLLKLVLIAFVITTVLGLACAVSRIGWRRTYPPADPFALPFGDVVHLEPFHSAGATALRRSEAGGGSHTSISPAASARTPPCRGEAFGEAGSLEDYCPRCGVLESSCVCSYATRERHHGRG